jgi:hypothetical protein
MPLLKELTAFQWLFSYKHCSPDGAPAGERFSSFALKRAGCPSSAPTRYSRSPRLRQFPLECFFQSRLSLVVRVVNIRPGQHGAILCHRVIALAGNIESARCI